MVRIKRESYLSDNYVDSFKQFPFPLSDFQKWAIAAIRDGNHCLVTAHTGSGKTVPAEFAIQYFFERGKKVIYTTPIKALSNQKLYDMRRKFPHIEFGILTGDCKDNPEADVLIMTTEILRNTLFNKQIIQSKENKQNKQNKQDEVSIPLHFDMDFETDLAAVVFDEVHYIADEDRGSVWEQAILLLPPHVQLIMLSATIAKPEQFASWVERQKQKKGSEKEVILSSTEERVVPLTHYAWFSAPKTCMKMVKGTPCEQAFQTHLHKPIVLKSAEGVFSDKHYYDLHAMLEILDKNRVFIARSFVLQKLIQYLKDHDMLPAMCFVFSRKHVEICASEVHLSLFPDDSTIPSTIAQDCKKILVSKLPNYHEYLDLPEYKKIVGFLEKGIGIHHAGIMPVFREMIEMLFERGHIKVLFATETFAVGINMPAKTVVFSGMMKYNGHTQRYLYPHEYTQMAGRAGRRNLDVVGHVIHCNNLFELPTSSEYKKILLGAPREITSQFKISYHLILNILASQISEDDDSIGDVALSPLAILENFIHGSMIHGEIENEIRGIEMEKETMNREIANKKQTLESLSTPVSILEEYYDMEQMIPLLKNKARKKKWREIEQLQDEYKNVTKHIEVYKEWLELRAHSKGLEEYWQNTKDYIMTKIQQVINILEKGQFVDTNICKTILSKGIVASHIQELHCLAIADLYEETDGFADLTSEQLVGLFSCFTNISIHNDKKLQYPETSDGRLREAIVSIYRDYEKYADLEVQEELETGIEYKIHFELIDICKEWCRCKDEKGCQVILRKLREEKEIFIGEFVKAILKINNIAAEFEDICERLHNISLLKKIKMIPEMTMKYIVSNQSLYI